MKEEKVYFKNKHGERLCGILTMPEAKSKKYALVILCHGFTSSKDSATYPFIAEKLYDAGILSLRFDFYGHGESGGKFEDITITEGVDDVLSAIDFAYGLSYIGKICLFGTSFGGVCSIIAASKTKRVHALGLKCPAIDIAELKRKRFGEQSFKKWEKEGFIIHKNHSGKEFRLNYSYYLDGISIDAYKAAGKISIPTLIIHGDQDASVPFEKSQKLAEVIKGSKLEIIKGANHYFDRPGEKEKINSKFIEFFKEVLA